MASYTTNLNLKKPAGSENVAIGDINNNMDTIDNAYGTLKSNLSMSSVGTVSNIYAFQSAIETLLGNNVFALWSITNTNAGNVGLASAGHFGFALADRGKSNIIVIAYRLNGSEIKINNKTNGSWNASWKTYSGE